MQFRGPILSDSWIVKERQGTALLTQLDTAAAAVADDEDDDVSMHREAAEGIMWESVMMYL